MYHIFTYIICEQFRNLTHNGSRIISARLNAIVAAKCWAFNTGSDVIDDPAL